MTPSLIDTAVVHGDTGGFSGTTTMPISKAVAVGKTLVVIVGNRWFDPWPPTLSDSQGNTYTQDVSGDDGAGDAIAIFHSDLTTALSTSDTLSITAPGRVFGNYVVWAASFDGVSGFDVAGAVVSGIGGGTLDASVTPSDGDLLFGAQISHGSSTNDTASPWTGLVSAFNSGATEVNAVYAVASGTSTVHYHPSATTTEVAVAVAFTATGVPTIDPTGIASGEAFGSAALSSTMHPTGIASGEAFGTAVLTGGAIVPTGIASGEAFGTAVLTGPLLPPSIGSGEAFGDAVVALAGHIYVIPGLESGEAFGDLAVLNWGDLTIAPAGFDDGEAFGEPSVSDVGTHTIQPAGII